MRQVVWSLASSASRQGVCVHHQPWPWPVIRYRVFLFAACGQEARVWPCRRRTPSLASVLEVMLSRANITTVDEFADLLVSAPTFIANFIRSEHGGSGHSGCRSTRS